MDFTDIKHYGEKTGIYGIRNTVNGYVYVGQTRECFLRRYWHHCSVLSNGNGTNINLQTDWNIYGGDSFAFEVLEEIEDLSLLDNAEKRWIKQYRDDGISYNISSGGSGRSAPMSDHAKAIVGSKNRDHMIGRKLSDETKQKMRTSSRHISPTEEHKEILRRYMSNRIVKDETRRKIGAHWDGEKSLTAKINNQQAADVKRLLINGLTLKEVAEQLDIKYGIVSQIAQGRTFQNVYVDGWLEHLAERKRRYAERMKK